MSAVTGDHPSALVFKFIAFTIPDNTAADIRVLKLEIGFVSSAVENPKQKPKEG
jgi:hypothetical protein